ncbi:MAG: LysR family transcriptional regulator [Herbaspirillum sp.]|nr:LysR family transcriptional regulator [Herbaspirillum sp.]
MSTNQGIALLNEMAVFAKVVEAGSFSAAARQLGATPSAISRSVARLEKALGTQLLQRTTRKLRLSDSGREIHARCRDMLDAAQSVLSVSGAFEAEPQGQVRVSVPKAVGRYLVHPHMPDFLQAYPKVDVLLRLEDRYMDLIDDQVDLAIRITDKPPPGLMGRPLMRIEHLLCATPGYLAAHGTPGHPQALKEHSCIYLGEEPADARWRFRRQGKVVNVEVRGRYAANHTGVRLDAVLRDIGIASLPYFIARPALEEGRIVQVLPQWTFRTRYCGDLWALYPATRHLPPRLGAFVNFLAGRLAAEATLAGAHGPAR